MSSANFNVHALTEETLAPEVKQLLSSLGLSLDELKKLKTASGKGPEGHHASSSSASSGTSGPASSAVHGDVGALLQQIATLQDENSGLKNKVSHLSQKTQEEMNRNVNTTINDWLMRMKGENNEKILEEFKKGLGRMAEASAEDALVYQVACMASEENKRNVTELERLRVENEELQQRVNGGRFGSEGDRIDKKRKSDVISSSVNEEKSAGGLWGEMETFFKTENGLM